MGSWAGEGERAVHRHGTQVQPVSLEGAGGPAMAVSFWRALWGTDGRPGGARACHQP